MEFERLSAGSLLEALDGVAYVVGLDGRIRACGSGNWERFAIANDGDTLDPKSLIGLDLLSIVQGDDVRGTYRAFHEALAAGRRARVGFAFRCDSPEMRRDLWMSISPIRSEGSVVALLYQSIVQAESTRPRMPLFDFAAHSGAGTDIPMILLCSWCQKVRWPPGRTATDRDAEWIEAEDYYRRGGTSDVLISHGMCPACFVRAKSD